jgi:ubiquinone/menaquinone biosynthesis C-methylase UbiE
MVMNAAASVPYIMDDPREAMRLELKFDPASWVDKYIVHHLTPGAHVLSVGCGPAVDLREIILVDPSIRATGIDISPKRIESAIRRNVPSARMKLICGDAHAMEFPSNGFDVVYSRMLFQYLADKERAMSELVRVCRPGGTVLVQDLDGQLLWHYPEDAAMQQATARVLSALAATGFDPFVGRKLFRLMQLAGLENVNVQVECYHLVAGEADSRILEQWKLKLEIALPQIAHVLGSQREAQKHISAFLEYLARPDTLTYSNVFTVTGEKPW